MAQAFACFTPPCARFSGERRLAVDRQTPTCLCTLRRSFPTELAGEVSPISPKIAVVRKDGVCFCCASSASEVTVETSVGVVVKTADSDDEFTALATLRAEAYYEDDWSRHVATFKRKFVSQELENLQDKTKLTRRGQPQVVCLVAIDTDNDKVLGGLDVRLSINLCGIHPKGVPIDDPTGCFVLNVVVDPNSRGKGVGRELMEAAQKLLKELGGCNVYTHVEADNEIACRLYYGAGYEVEETVNAIDPKSNLGKVLLLKAVIQ